MWIFCPIPKGFRRFLFEPENKSPGVSPGSTPGKANDKCIKVKNNLTTSSKKLPRRSGNRHNFVQSELKTDFRH